MAKKKKLMRDYDKQDPATLLELAGEIESARKAVKRLMSLVHQTCQGLGGYKRHPDVDGARAKLSEAWDRLREAQDLCEAAYARIEASGERHEPFLDTGGLAVVDDDLQARLQKKAMGRFTAGFNQILNRKQAEMKARETGEGDRKDE